MNTTGIEKGTVDRDKAESRSMVGHIKSVNRDERTAEGVASTIYIDRDGEIILPSSMGKSLPAFLATSSPFQAYHLSRGSDGEPVQIGWVDSARIDKYEVPCTFRYARTRIAEEWWEIASDPKGKGHGFSIGFIGLAYIRGMPSDLIKAYPELKETFKGDHDPDQLYTVWTEIELLEISGCGVPSNRHTFTRDAAAAGLDEVALARLAVLVAEKVLAGGTRDQAATMLDALKALEARLIERFDTIEMSLPDTLGAAPPADDAPGPDDGGDAPAATQRGKNTTDPWKRMAARAARN